MNLPAVDLACPNCGARNTPSALVCWLCQQGPKVPPVLSGSTGRHRNSPLTRGPKVPPVVSNSAGKGQTSSLTFSIASVLLVTTLCAVFFSVLMMAPGLAILLAILSVPALVRTGLAAKRRAQLGKPISPIRKLLWFMSSLTVTTILVVVVLVASVGTFCAVCLTANSQDAIPVAFLAAGVVAIGVLVASFYGIQYRWQRDVHG